MSDSKERVSVTGRVEMRDVPEFFRGETKEQLAIRLARQSLRVLSGARNLEAARLHATRSLERIAEVLGETP